MEHSLGASYDDVTGAVIGACSQIMTHQNESKINNQITVFLGFF